MEANSTEVVPVENDQPKAIEYIEQASAAKNLTRGKQKMNEEVVCPREQIIIDDVEHLLRQNKYSVLRIQLEKAMERAAKGTSPTKHPP